MDSKDCRRKAEEFRLAAAATGNNLRERLGWLILCNAWNSLANRIDDVSIRQKKKTNGRDAGVTRDDRGALAEKAVEKLLLAERRILELEKQQREAEASINEARVKLQQVGEDLQKERDAIRTEILRQGPPASSRPDAA